MRDAKTADCGDILTLNEAEEMQTSPMTIATLRCLNALSSYHKVKILNGKVAAFLLAVREGASYENLNYYWFSARYEKFLYIDRVVVDSNYSRKGIGSAMYKKLLT